LHDALPIWMRDGQTNDVVALLELDALYARRVAAHGAHLRLIEADALSQARPQDEVTRTVGNGGREEQVVVLDADADDALFTEVLVVEERRLLDLAAARQRDDVAPVLDGVDRRDGGDALTLFEADEVDDGAPLGVRRRLRHLVHLAHVDLAQVAEEEDVRVRAGDEQLADPVVVLRLHATPALAAALLRLVGVGGGALDVTRVRDGHDHVLGGDQVLDGDLRLVLLDGGAALLAVLLGHLLELGDDQLHQERLAGQDGAQA